MRGIEKMKNRYFVAAALLAGLCFSVIGDAAEASKDIALQKITFVPPEGWRKAEEAQLPPRVEVLVVGESSQGFPPSLNLATENYRGTLKEYLKVVKSINDAKGNQWKNLGPITSDVGVGNLSQVDSKNKWGDLRMMHAIFLKEETIYILTATALKEEFSLLYKKFFDSFRSLKISEE